MSGPEIAVFTGYEIVFVLMPGWVLYGVLRPDAPRVERFAFGWALGYALVIAAFALTAAVGARSLLFGYPILVGAVGLWQLRRSGAGSTAGVDGHWNWITAAVTAVATGMVAVALFPPNPLPGSVHRVTYFLDNVFQISLAGTGKCISMV